MSYLFPLCIQLTMPENPNCPAFVKTLQCLQKKGFYGVELNLTRFDTISPAELVGFLSDFDLRLTMVASGAYAKKHALSLSSAQETVRQKSVDALFRMSQYAAACDAGVICGFIKGGAIGNVQKAQKGLQASLNELCARDAFSKADIYLEATNHHEALLVNTVAQGVVYAKTVPQPLYVLPDTYHMQMEEADMFASLKEYQSYYRNVHLSDDNRFFPGFGAIPFEDVLGQLKNQGYTGTITIEGNIKKDLLTDIEMSADYLARCAAICTTSL